MFICKRAYVQFNSSLYSQTGGQNRAKLLEMFKYVTQIVPWNTRANHLNVSKIYLWRHLLTSWHPKISCEETSIAKELVLLIPWLWCWHIQRYRLRNFWPHEPPCANEYAKEKEKEEKEKNTTLSTKYFGVLLKTISNYLLTYMLI